MPGHKPETTQAAAVPAPTHGHNQSPSPTPHTPTPTHLCMVLESRLCCLNLGLMLRQVNSSLGRLDLGPERREGMDIS